MRNERGWTRWSAVGAIVLAALVAPMPGCGPLKSPPTNWLRCQARLRQIGALLMARDEANSLRRVDGAAFLLQVAEDVSDEDLKAFLCPMEQNPDPARPQPGTPEFLDLYRKVLPRDGPNDRMCSYAGPDFTNYPDRPGDGRRIWACDRCRGGVPHHRQGLVVLWSTGKVETIPYREIAGCDPESLRVILGPDSPDPRLRPLIFLPAPRR